MKCECSGRFPAVVYHSALFSFLLVKKRTNLHKRSLIKKKGAFHTHSNVKEAMTEINIPSARSTECWASRCGPSLLKVATMHVSSWSPDSCPHHQHGVIEVVSFYIFSRKGRGRQGMLGCLNMSSPSKLPRHLKTQSTLVILWLPLCCLFTARFPPPPGCSVHRAIQRAFMMTDSASLGWGGGGGSRREKSQLICRESASGSQSWLAYEQQAMQIERYFSSKYNVFGNLSTVMIFATPAGLKETPTVFQHKPGS